MPRPVEPHEAITRFLFSSDHFAPSRARVKAPAIAPVVNRRSGRLECSVYRVDGASGDEVWQICSMHVDQHGTNRIAKARAVCSANIMLSEGLKFDPNGVPHPRHADVIDWPTEKHSQKILQLKIAAAMSLELRPATVK